MCAAGHITRLTNVLVGFDDKFKAQISIQEMFQNAMGTISAMDCATEEKQEMARKVMDDMKIPEEERAPWLDAF
jgi:fido (protein-threonine AMPylation protein)